MKDMKEEKSRRAVLDMATTIQTDEIGCWNCAISGIKNGKPVCPDCGTKIAPLCKAYSHEKIRIVVKER